MESWLNYSITLYSSNKNSRNNIQDVERCPLWKIVKFEPSLVYKIKRYLLYQRTFYLLNLFSWHLYTFAQSIFLPIGVRPPGKKHCSSQIWQYSWGLTWSRQWSACCGPRCTLITIRKLSSTQAVIRISSPLLHLEADLVRKPIQTLILV